MVASNKHPLVAYQPFKFLFQLAYFTTIIARLPLWLTLAFFAPLRPHPKWTAKQTFMAQVAYALTDLKSRIGVTSKLSLEQGKEEDRFQVIEPSNSEAYKGPLTSLIVKPGSVGGTWYPKAPGKDIASKIVVLYLHGGAFVEGDGRNEFCGYPVKTMIERGGVDAVFSLQYRLSGWMGVNPFPAALQDALTAYLFLVEKVQIPSHQIVLCGDSAGGNLAITLLRYLEEFGTTIPRPRCVTLFSPWVAPFDYNTEQNPNRNSDFLPTSFLRWGAHTYADGLLNSPSDPYITPLGNPFATSVPIFVNAGNAEIFFVANKKWVKQMKDVKDNHVDFHEEDAALHDTFLLASILGFEESAQEVILKMGTFVRKC
ncbi:alpha/beta-Hydrolase [Glarea lozoyensis ATCC 20868]|uniref:Alpha/beta-Hydrolase n=1 Tax=Glarea lozoyensis (strain ATCC 20868 / MF5171) TaxID=1116229 RepID=S3CYN3_GLAL2|nr:alpha/beta-Hydrolase [Glarea lozoyensis ATCC 20868]EPE24941.1 alpha/beta-Hydrolase [Glarea lozoyensis ATCC 20868]